MQQRASSFEQGSRIASRPDCVTHWQVERAVLFDFVRLYGEKTEERAVAAQATFHAQRRERRITTLLTPWSNSLAQLSRPVAMGSPRVCNVSVTTKRTCSGR